MSSYVNLYAAGIVDAPERWTRSEQEAHADQPLCPATSPDPGFECTGPEGHDGPHFADGLGRCLAMWRDR